MNNLFMDLQILHDKALIYNFLKKNPGLQLYSIGDLDDFFWSKTTWFALMEADAVQSIALLYAGTDLPVLLLFYEGESYFSHQLLERIKPILPAKFYAHLSPGLIDAFGRQSVSEYHGLHYKMILTKAVSEQLDKNIKRLSVKDLSGIKDFYAAAYPQNWFDSRMLETGKYYGYFINGKLTAVAGIHVYSEEYKAAALGNIAVHPDHRSRGIGYRLTSALCSDLQKHAEFIGLNVKADNENTIKCYKKIGFEITGTYEECCIRNAYT